jgi:hypothetical protein
LIDNNIIRFVRIFAPDDTGSTHAGFAPKYDLPG